MPRSRVVHRRMRIPERSTARIAADAGVRLRRAQSDQPHAGVSQVLFDKPLSTHDVPRHLGRLRVPRDGEVVQVLRYVLRLIYDCTECASVEHTSAERSTTPSNGGFVAVDDRIQPAELLGNDVALRIQECARPRSPNARRCAGVNAAAYVPGLPNCVTART